MEFEKVIAAGVKLQQQLPWLEMVAVGGSAAAIHCRHRYSQVIDCVTPLLRQKFDTVQESLLQWPDWKTNRVSKPVLILGESHDVELGLRQQRREAPLKKTQIDGLWVPTVDEALRIKAFLLTNRLATRDYLDVAALSDKLGLDAAVKSLSHLNLLYTSKNNTQTPLTQFSEACFKEPLDLEATNVATYKGVVPPYNDWEEIRKRVSELGKAIALRELSGDLPVNVDLME